MTPENPPAPPPRTLIVVATYNERENLPLLVEELRHWAPQADVLVVDDNSPDGTGRWCDEEAARDPRLRCLHRPGKLGLGTAALDGFRHALADGYEVVVTIDADLSHPPRRVPELLALVTGEPAAADVAIGSRYVPGGAIEGWPWRRRWMSRAVNLYARTLLRLPVRDCSGAFRAYRADALGRLDLAAIKSRGYAYLEEILYRLHRQGARLVESPITFVERRRGVSKINLREAVAALWRMLVLAAGRA